MNIIGLLFICFFPVVHLYGLTRSQVISNAISFTEVNWKCIVPNEEYGFRTGVIYSGEAYCYGGNDSIQEFLNKISAGAIPRVEAGIDCSAFVSRCWEISRQTTATLPNFCLQISRQQLKPGDILNSMNRHVVLVSGYFNGLIQIYHAKGWGNPNPGESGYPGQMVVFETVNENYFDNSYVAYTPFPIFTDWSPTKDSITNGTPQIKVKIKSGTNILADSIVMKLDGEVVPATISSSADAKEILVSYKPQQPLCEGKHTVYIYAKNEIDLEDDDTNSFYVDTTPPEINLKEPPDIIWVPPSEWPGGDYKSSINYPVKISFDAIDNIAVDDVYAYVDGKLVGRWEDLESDIFLSTTTLCGWSRHTLTITATDLAGN
jgi:hypothetical protein